MTAFPHICISITVVCSLAILQVQGGLIPQGRHTSVKDHLNAKLTDYEITVPYLSTPEGRFISHRLTGQEDFGDNDLLAASAKRVRNRRSQPRGGADKDSMHFSVQAFGSEFTLNVRLNSHLLAPNAVVEWTNVERDFTREEKINKECFYVGDVKNTPGSAVAISNCDGLAGLIQVDGEDYFIEPLEKNVTSSSSGSESGRQHVIYKRSAIKPRQKRGSDDFEVASPKFLGEASTLLGDNIKQRVKRGTGEKNMEVLLTADHSVVAFHGTLNIQLYLLTLMNIVNNIYKHPSLGMEINIVLVRIILLDASQGNLIILNNPSKSLENVCTWANTQQNKDNTDKPHHDHAIFLSRQVFGPAGYAPVTGMCHLLRSCTLNQEDGLSSAFVVAHETGHVLGMEHDGQGNVCSNEADMGSIMAPLVQANFNLYFWSTCSKEELKNNINAYICLDDDPFAANFPDVSHELPGMTYSADDQCRFDFGEGYRFCSGLTGISVCQQLWCNHPDTPYHCKTKKGPPLDGTPCGRGKYCLDGECIVSTVQVVHGAWGQWSEYTECSRTCGVGAQMRTRECNNPRPSNSGDDCKGQNVEFRLCNTQDCPNPAVDFRAEQCENNYQNWKYKNRKHTWLPDENKNNSLQCKLTCISQETGDIIVSSYNVIDGTKCSYDDSNNVCVQGQCQTVGCDKILGSSAREDHCGVCGGDNTSCETITGTYNKTPRKTYQKIVPLPKGTRNLDIFETSPSGHSFALKDKATGRYIFKGATLGENGAAFVAAGTLFRLTVRNDRDRMTAKGPLTADLVVLARAKSGGKENEEMKVSYQYTIGKKQVKSPNPRVSNRIPNANSRFNWVEMGWSKCSKECNGGEQYYKFICQRKTDKKAVSKRLCNPKTQPQKDRRRSCNEQPCEGTSYDWNTGEWEYCSKTCGNEGWQIRTINCMKTENGVRTSVHNRYCKAEKPTNRQVCNRNACPAYWQTGEWSKCSATCGVGTQQRQVVCGYPNRNRVTWQCDDYPKPETTRSCDAGPCAGADNECAGDKSIFCSLEVLNEYCSLPGYSKLCCRTCNDVTTSSP